MALSGLGMSRAVAEDLHSGLLGRWPMLTSNRLRIDLGDGSCTVDYRIYYGCVESRILESAEKGRVIEKPWHLLTATELSSHVMADTLVAHWLRHRMGIHQLIQACNQDTSFVINDAQERSDGEANEAPANERAGLG